MTKPWEPQQVEVVLQAIPDSRFSTQLVEAAEALYDYFCQLRPIPAFHSAEPTGSDFPDHPATGRTGTDG